MIEETSVERDRRILEKLNDAAFIEDLRQELEYLLTLVVIDAVDPFSDLSAAIDNALKEKDKDPSSHLEALTIQEHSDPTKISPTD